MTRIAKRIYLSLVVLSAGVGIGIAVHKTHDKLPDTTPVVRGDLTEAAYAVGTVRADRTFNLKIGVASRVVDRFVRLGDAVKKGSRLITFDGIPTYRAPFDGFVTAINFDVGELAFAQTAVMTVVSNQSLYLELSMDERVIGTLRIGQEASISFEGQRGAPKKGTIRSIYASDGQFLVVVDFDAAGLSLFPGMTADVAITTGILKGQLLIPLAAVQNTNKIKVMRSQPVEIDIMPGPNDGRFVVVTNDGLHEGDLVVLPATSMHESAGNGAH